MNQDSVVEEVRRARDQHAKKFGYDIDAIVQDLRKHEKGLRRVVSLEAKPAHLARGAA